MRRVGLLLLLAVLMAAPAWAWSRHAAATRERDAGKRSLTLARAHVTELMQASSSRGSVLEAVPESEIVAAVNSAATDSGLPLSSIRELSVRIEEVRAARGASAVQRTQVSLSATSPRLLGRFLEELGQRLTTAVPTSIRITHANTRDGSDLNRFDVVLVLEQVVLSGQSGENR